CGPTEQELASSSGRFQTDDNYYLVVASLVNEADADEFIANSKNKQLGILAKDGRYRIYAATGVTYREALSAADLLADSYSSAWVCRK
ncbi:MAG: SPOR domain-containing protein, partial [Muribaculaceae bacterium]|nr:SPOR domain-containing protein [Muribaculaceae bacterium]